MRRLLREPLLHFVLGGALLFWASAHLAPQAPDVASSREIVVTEDHLAAWRKELARMYGREPTDEEVAEAARDFVDEEILYREALSLGLDNADLVVRRRLAQKMRFLLEDTTPLAPATEADLVAWYEQHGAEFTEPARVSVTHVFVSADAHEDAAAEAARLRERLVAAGPPPADGPGLGDAFPAGSTFENASERELTNYLGAALARRAMQLPLHEWSEPLASPWGVHLLWVSDRMPARVPPLDEVRERAQLAFDDARREAANETRIAELRARYDVSMPPSVGATTP